MSTVCKHWLRGLCKKSDACEFLHEYNLRRMPECWWYAKFGYCQAGDECLYVHPREKKIECPDYKRGFCKLGAHHRFRIHCMLSDRCPKVLNAHESTSGASLAKPILRAFAHWDQNALAGSESYVCFSFSFFRLTYAVPNRLFRSQVTTKCPSSRRKSSVRHPLATAVTQTSLTAGLSTHQRPQASPAEDSDIRAREEIWMTCCVTRYVVMLV